MKWTEGVNCKTQCGAIPRCYMTESRSSSIDSDDITVARNFFLIIVILILWR